MGKGFPFPAPDSWGTRQGGGTYPPPAHLTTTCTPAGGSRSGFVASQLTEIVEKAVTAGGEVETLGFGEDVPLSMEGKGGILRACHSKVYPYQFRGRRLGGGVQSPVQWAWLLLHSPLPKPEFTPGYPRRLFICSL